MKNVNFVERLNNGEKLKIVTYGPCFFADNLRPNPWVVPLSKKWQKEYPDQVEFCIRGLGGVNSMWGIDNLNKMVIDEKPDVLMMEWAINDAKQNSLDDERGGVTVEKCEKNLRQLIDTISKALPNCEIVLWTTTPISTKGRDIHLAEYYQVNRKVAEEMGLKLVDLYPEFMRLKKDDPSLYWLCLSPDEGHLTRYGAKKLVIPKLLETLSVNDVA